MWKVFSMVYWDGAYEANYTGLIGVDICARADTHLNTIPDYCSRYGGITLPVDRNRFKHFLCKLSGGSELITTLNMT